MKPSQRWAEDAAEEIATALCEGVTDKNLGTYVAQIASVIMRYAPSEYATKADVIAVIDYFAKPIQDGGEGMADNATSPLMKLRAEILEGKNERE